MKVVVFDFDGVIIPSEGIKQQGYSWMFSEYGEDVPEIAIQEAREEFANAKGDRYDVIRGIFLRMGVRGDIKQKVEEYSARFNTIVKNKIEAFQVEPLVLARLQSLGKANTLYINSNTPDEPLKGALHKLGIATLFKGIYGSALSKSETMRAIARLEKIPTSEFVFIGDGVGDRDASAECGSKFIGVATSSNGWTPETMPFSVVLSVADITDELVARVI